MPVVSPPRPIASALLGAVLVAGPSSAAETIPKTVGTCAETVVTAIGTRFGPKLVRPAKGESDDGTSVELRNGVYGVSYEFVAAVAASRVGDRVITCLVSIPKGCPRGDARGRTYTTTNLRTQESWTLGDSQHLCGGA